MMNSNFYHLPAKEKRELGASDITCRIPLYHPSIPFVFLWSEKSGCTAVVKWFFFQLGILDEALEYSSKQWVHEYENKVFKKAGGYLKSLAQAINKGIPAYKFVRDPYARAYSQYLILTELAAIGQQRHFAYQTRRTILDSLVGPSAPQALGFSFVDFLEWISDQDLHDLNPHLRPQHSDFEDFFDIRIAMIETMEASLEELAREYNLKKMGGKREQILGSGHYVPKANTTSQDEICRFLEYSVPAGRRPNFHVPKVDKRNISHTYIGQKIKDIFDSDFQKYSFT